MWACQEGSLDIVKILIDKGSHINGKDDVSYTITRCFLVRDHHGSIEIGTERRNCIHGGYLIIVVLKSRRS